MTRIARKLTRRIPNRRNSAALVVTACRRATAEVRAARRDRHVTRVRHIRAVEVNRVVDVRRISLGIVTVSTHSARIPKVLVVCIARYSYVTYGTVR